MISWDFSKENQNIFLHVRFFHLARKFYYDSAHRYAVYKTRPIRLIISYLRSKKNKKCKEGNFTIFLVEGPVQIFIQFLSLFTIQMWLKKDLIYPYKYFLLISEVSIQPIVLHYASSSIMYSSNPHMHIMLKA